MKSLVRLLTIPVLTLIIIILMALVVFFIFIYIKLENVDEVYVLLRALKRSSILSFIKISITSLILNILLSIYLWFIIKKNQYR